MSELNTTYLKTGTTTSHIAETVCIPDPCGKCKGSGKLVIALPTEEGVEIPEGIDRATWFALKHQGGMGFVSPRPVCPDCLGVGILVADLPGEYPPPPKDKKRFGLSPDQKLAIDEVMAWMSTKEKRKTLGGFAGTGKTTAAYAPDAEEGERVNSHLFDRLHELEGMLERSRNKVASLEQLLLKTCTGEPNKEDK